MIEDLCYKNAVSYALNVDSFMDGNGDGCGDLEGLMRRLDYLESLGVDAIWIGPFQTSPNAKPRFPTHHAVSVDFATCPELADARRRLSSPDTPICRRSRTPLLLGPRVVRS